MIMTSKYKHWMTMITEMIKTPSQSLADQDYWLAK